MAEGIESVDLYNESNAVTLTKSSRLRWAGHVARIDENDLPKKILCTKPGGQGGRGRSKSRWIDGMKKDAKKPGCRNWLTADKDRSRWQHFLEEAKGHLGL